MCRAGRAGCHENGLSGSTEARRRNPAHVPTSSRCKGEVAAGRVIPTFYPMEFSYKKPRNGGDAETPGCPRAARPSCVEVGERSFSAANPPTGFGRSNAAARSTYAGVGSLWLVTVRAGPLTRLGYSSKSGDANSSTMKGPKGLAGKFTGRRCRECRARTARFEPTVKSLGRRVRRSFCVLPSEISLLSESWILCRGGNPDIRPTARGITPASHVNQ